MERQTVTSSLPPRINGTYLTLSDTALTIDGIAFWNVNGVEMGDGWIVLSVFLCPRDDETLEQFLAPLKTASAIGMFIEKNGQQVLIGDYANLVMASCGYEVSQRPARRELTEDDRRAGTGCLWVCRIRYEAQKQAAAPLPILHFPGPRDRYLLALDAMGPAIDEESFTARRSIVGLIIVRLMQKWSGETYRGDVSTGDLALDEKHRLASELAVALAGTEFKASVSCRMGTIETDVQPRFYQPPSLV